VCDGKRDDVCLSDWLRYAAKLFMLSLLGGCAAAQPAFENSRDHVVSRDLATDRIPTSVSLRAPVGQPESPARDAQAERMHPPQPVKASADLLLDEIEADEGWYGRARRGTLWTDQRNFYTRSDYRFAAMNLALAATFAHTDVDEDFRNWWQEDVRSNAWDDFSHFAKPLGDGYISVAIMGAGAVFGSLASETQIGALSGEWGRRSIRSLAVGTPALLFLQAATGGGRPGEWSSESDWVPFHDTNGVSGHTFMGAVPFLVAAQMTDNRLLSGLWYTGSVMCGVSRINDDAHYLSQVILGWSLAKLACKAVDLTESERADLEVVPMVGHGGTVGIGVQFRR